MLSLLSMRESCQGAVLGHFSVQSGQILGKVLSQGELGLVAGQDCVCGGGSAQHISRQRVCLQHDSHRCSRHVADPSLLFFKNVCHNPIWRNGRNPCCLPQNPELLVGRSRSQPTQSQRLAHTGVDADAINTHGEKSSEIIHPQLVAQLCYRDNLVICTSACQIFPPTPKHLGSEFSCISRYF